jgi:hypothetical protein
MLEAIVICSGKNQVGQAKLLNAPHSLQERAVKQKHLAIFDLEGSPDWVI